MFIQSQSAQSSAYDYLGFERIAEECTEWPSDQKFFGSVVNHQDWEDFDSMPFGAEGGECRVEIANPHGDAPWPMKVVSFVNKEGETRVGLVGLEEDVELVEELVKQVKGAVEELAGLGDGRVILDLGLRDEEGMQEKGGSARSESLVEKGEEGRSGEKEAVAVFRQEATRDSESVGEDVKGEGHGVNNVTKAAGRMSSKAKLLKMLRWMGLKSGSTMSSQA